MPWWESGLSGPRDTCPTATWEPALTPSTYGKFKATSGLSFSLIWWDGKAHPPCPIVLLWEPEHHMNAGKEPQIRSNRHNHRQ